MPNVRGILDMSTVGTAFNSSARIEPNRLLARRATRSGPAGSGVCTENLKTGVVVVKSAQDGA